MNSCSKLGQHTNHYLKWFPVSSFEAQDCCVNSGYQHYPSFPKLADGTPLGTLRYVLNRFADHGAFEDRKLARTALRSLDEMVRRMRRITE